MKHLRQITVGMLLITGLMLTACNQKKDNNSNRTAVASPYGMPGSASGFQNLMASATGTGSMWGGQVDVAFDFYSAMATTAYNPYQTQQYPYNGQTQQYPYNNGTVYSGTGSPTTYSGAVSANGYLRVSATGNNGMSICGIYPGEYLLTAIQPGQMMNGTATGIRLSGTGSGGMIQATVVRAVLVNSAATYNDPKSFKVLMTLQLDVVNGQPCNQTLTTY